MFRCKGILGFISGVIITLILTTSVFAAPIEQTIKVIYNNIKVIVNGIQIDMRDANNNKVEPFNYNGTVYLPVRAIGQALGKDVRWDGKNNAVVVSDIQDDSAGQIVYVGDGIVPFNHQRGHEYHGVKIVYDNEVKWENSSTYGNQTLLSDNLNNEFTNYILMHIFKRFSTGDIASYVSTDLRWQYIDFPLQKNYKKFNATFGLTGGSSNTEYEITLKVFADNNKIYEKTLKAGDFPEEIDLDISNVNKLTFRVESTGSRTSYEAIGLFNARFTK